VKFFGGSHIGIIAAWLHDVMEDRTGHGKEGPRQRAGIVRERGPGRMAGVHMVIGEIYRQFSETQPPYFL
jgi:hypothetical protein